MNWRQCLDPLLGAVGNDSFNIETHENEFYRRLLRSYEFARFLNSKNI